MNGTNRMSLAHRIASMRVLPHPSLMQSVPVTLFIPMIERHKKAIQESPHFCLDNIFDFYASHEKQNWCLEHDVPNCSPPFRRFWAEWFDDPELWNIKGLTAEDFALFTPTQVGVMVESHDVTDNNRTDSQMWYARMVSSTGLCSGIAKFPSDEVVVALSKTRWLLTVNHWHCILRYPPGKQAKSMYAGSPVFTGITSFVFVSDAGKCVYSFESGIGVEETDFGSGSCLQILGLGLSFCHCKNVTRQEQIADRGERWHRRTGIPTIRQYTLEIGPMRETLRREGRSGEVGIGRALHICRGHFANYTPDHPLFGKYVGTFWRPDHVRGKKERGEVVKDYSVKTP